MRRIIITITIVMALALNVDAKKKQVVILHTNDTHSCIYPLNPTLADTLLAGRGGFIRRAEMIKQQREENPNLLLIDSGDFSQGSPYYTMYKGDVEIGLMNRMGYDAATIGNHEFDFGVENMARIFKEANFPVVCANYDFIGTSLEGIVKPYVILKKNGLKIGLFGISPQLEGLVFAKTCEGVTYNDPITKANEVADILKNKEKCDIVICISHLGWNIGGIDDNKLMAQTRNIDLVLGGHSHTYLETIQYVKNLDGKEIPNDQNGKSGIFVGKIVLDIDKAKK
ncbi:MAG: metallophosphatase [Prevotella sp.]|nr:metallophosphatase [Prevotella sp.]